MTSDFNFNSHRNPYLDFLKGIDGDYSYRPHDSESTDFDDPLPDDKIRLKCGQLGTTDCKKPTCRKPQSRSLGINPPGERPAVDGCLPFDKIGTPDFATAKCSKPQSKWLSSDHAIDFVGPECSKPQSRRLPMPTMPEMDMDLCRKTSERPTLEVWKIGTPDLAEPTCSKPKSKWLHADHALDFADPKCSKPQSKWLGSNPPGERPAIDGCLPFGKPTMPEVDMDVCRKMSKGDMPKCSKPQSKWLGSNPPEERPAIDGCLPIGKFELPKWEPRPISPVSRNTDSVNVVCAAQGTQAVIELPKLDRPRISETRRAEIEKCFGVGIPRSRTSSCVSEKSTSESDHIPTAVPIAEFLKSEILNVPLPTKPAKEVVTAKSRTSSTSSESELQQETTVEPAQQPASSSSDSVITKMSAAAIPDSWEQPVKEAVIPPIDLDGYFQALLPDIVRSHSTSSSSSEKAVENPNLEPRQHVVEKSASSSRTEAFKHVSAFVEKIDTVEAELPKSPVTVANRSRASSSSSSSSKAPRISAQAKPEMHGRERSTSTSSSTSSKSSLANEPASKYVIVPTEKLVARRSSSNASTSSSSSSSADSAVQNTESKTQSTEIRKPFVYLHASANDLRKTSLTGKPDPYYELWYDDELLYRSEKIDDTYSPNWKPAKISTESWEKINSNAEQKLRVKIYDHDPLTPDDLLGSSKIPLPIRCSEYPVGYVNWKSQIKNVGIFRLNRIQGPTAETSSTLESVHSMARLHASARGLRNADVVGKSDPYYELWCGKNRFYKSEVVANSLEPKWRPAEISRRDFEGLVESGERNVVVKVYDKDPTTDDLLGMSKMPIPLIPAEYPLRYVNLKNQVTDVGTFSLARVEQPKMARLSNEASSVSSDDLLNEKQTSSTWLESIFRCFKSE